MYVAGDDVSSIATFQIWRSHEPIRTHHMQSEALEFPHNDFAHANKSTVFTSLNADTLDPLTTMRDQDH
jgi:hypothetical protein